MTTSLIFSTALDPPTSPNQINPDSLTARLRALRKTAAKHTTGTTIAERQANALRSHIGDTAAAFDTIHIAKLPRISVLRSVTTSELTAPHFWDKAWRIIIDHDAPQPAQRFAICWAYKHILDANQAQPTANGHVLATHFADHLLVPTTRLQQLINDGTTNPQTLAEIFNAPLEVVRRQLKYVHSRTPIPRHAKQTAKETT